MWWRQHFSVRSPGVMSFALSLDYQPDSVFKASALDFYTPAHWLLHCSERTFVFRGEGWRFSASAHGAAVCCRQESGAPLEEFTCLSALPKGTWSVVVPVSAFLWDIRDSNQQLHLHLTVFWPLFRPTLSSPLLPAGWVWIISRLLLSLVVTEQQCIHLEKHCDDEEKLSNPNKTADSPAGNITVASWKISFPTPILFASLRSHNHCVPLQESMSVAVCGFHTEKQILFQTLPQMQPGKCSFFSPEFGRRNQCVRSRSSRSHRGGNDYDTGEPWTQLTADVTSQQKPKYPLLNKHISAFGWCLVLISRGFINTRAETMQIDGKLISIYSDNW